MKPSVARKLNEKIRALESELEQLRSNKKVKELEKKVQVGPERGGPAYAWGGGECVGAGGGVCGACLGVRAGAAAQQQKGQRAGEKSAGALSTLSLVCVANIPAMRGGQGDPVYRCGGL